MARIEELEQQIKALEERRKQILARKQRLEQRQLSKLGKEMRKEDTRRKILAGSMILKSLDEGQLMSKASFMAAMDAFLTRDDDRALFNLPSKP